MLVALIIISLGVLVNILVFANSKTAYPRFTRTCSKCGYRLPPIEYHTAIHSCPGCAWLNDTQNR